MAHITPYPGNRFRAVVRRTGYKTQSHIFPTRKAAELWAAQIEADMLSHVYQEPGTFARDTVGSVFERFRDEICPGRKGGRWEVVRINNFLKNSDFMRLQIKQLQGADLRDWRNDRLKAVSPQSVNREMNLLSTVFSYAIKEWGYTFPGGANPMTLVSRPEGGKGEYRHRRWSREELDAILTAAGHDEQKIPKLGKEHMTWALLLGLETAMRPSEMCTVLVEDVYPQDRYIQLHDSKNGESRKVPLSKRAVQICEKLVTGKEPKQKLLPMTAESLGVFFRKARRKAGLEGADLRFYDIKHESISRLSKKFANVLELSAVTGHRSLQSLKHYYNPTVDELAAKLD